MALTPVTAPRKGKTAAKKLSTKKATKQPKGDGAQKKTAPSTSDTKKVLDLKPRPAPQELPGMERQRDPELELLGERLDARSTELSMLRAEVGEIKQRLLQAMDDRNLANYRMDNGITIHVEPKESVKLIRPDDD